MSADPNTAAMFRCFVAIEVGEEVKGKLAEIQASLRRTHAHVRWVSLENVHLTLMFLGDICADSVPVVASAVAAVCKPCATFQIKVAGLGTFGSRRAPRIVWAGVENASSLQQLQAGILAVLRNQGLNLDDKPFRPHLTLGRVRSGRGREALMEAVGTAEEEVFGQVPVTEVRLMRSVLDPTGAKYSVLHRAPLQG